MLLFWPIVFTDRLSTADSLSQAQFVDMETTIQWTTITYYLLENVFSACDRFVSRLTVVDSDVVVTCDENRTASTSCFFSLLCEDGTRDKYRAGEIFAIDMKRFLFSVTENGRNGAVSPSHTPEFCIFWKRCQRRDGVLWKCKHLHLHFGRFVESLSQLCRQSFSRPERYCVGSCSVSCR